MASSNHAPNWKAWRLNPPTAIPTAQDASDALPRLPVPDLEATLKKLVESSAPLAKDSKELETLQRKIKAFAAEQGPKLQEKLRQRAADP